MMEGIGLLISQHLGSIALAALTTGTVSILIKSYFAKPKTIAEAKKSEAEAAIILVEGWRGITDTLKEQLTVMEKRYEDKIGALEKKMAEREIWYSQNLAVKDGQIATLERQVRSLQRQLDKYETMKDKIDTAKKEIGNTIEESKAHLTESVEHALEEAKKPEVEKE